VNLNRIRVNEYAKKWRDNNLDKAKNNQKNRYNKKSKIYKENSKEYREKYPEKVKLCINESRKKHSEKYKITRKTYTYNNRKRINSYSVFKRKENQISKLSHSLRKRIRLYLKSKGIVKNNKTFDIICCTPQELKISHGKIMVITVDMLIIKYL
jgi:hypothetical protein